MSFFDPADPLRRHGARLVALLLALFALVETGAPRLPATGRLALFAGGALMLCFLVVPPARFFRHSRWARGLDLALAGAALLWTLAQLGSLGRESDGALPLGWLFLLLLLEGLRRTSGATLPVLLLLALGYAAWQGEDPGRLLGGWPAGEDDLQAPLRAIFESMFLVGLFGAFLELFGVGAWLGEQARRLAGPEPGASARLVVLAQALRGAISRTSLPQRAELSLVPRMKHEGLPAELAAALEAATTVGRSLIPPVLGAGAFLMLVTVEPRVELLTVMKAALLPAFLFYLSLYLVARWRVEDLDLGAAPLEDSATVALPLARKRLVGPFEGVILGAAVAVLVAALAAGWAIPFAVPAALGAAALLAFAHPRTRPTPAGLLDATVHGAAGMVPLALAGAAVPWVLHALGVGGLAESLATLVRPLADQHLLPLLLVVMVLSLVVGMGMPAILAYLLPAILLAPLLADLGVLPLAAHFFVFYFGLLAVITPPVAPAVDAAATIARSPRGPTARLALRLSATGFVLPFLFVYRPQLLMLDPAGGPAAPLDFLIAATVATLGIVPLAAAEAGHFGRKLGRGGRVAMALIAGLIVFPAAGPPQAVPITWVNLAGVALLAVAAIVVRRRRAPADSQS